MSVTKHIAEVYTVRHDGEFGTFCIVEWAPRTDDHGPVYGGELLVNSTFGAYCNSWSHCGQPFKRFLAKIEFDYFMGKCRGRAADVFDGEKSLKLVKERVIQLRRQGWLDHGAARELWCELTLCREEIERSPDDFVRVISDLNVRRLSEPWELIVTRPASDTVGFWRDLWPSFISALSQEQAGADGTQLIPLTKKG